MKFLLLIPLFFLLSCASDKNVNDTKNSINFNKDMSFEEFKVNLDKYVKNSSYPNIDN